LFRHLDPPILLLGDSRLHGSAPQPLGKTDWDGETCDHLLNAPGG
jgi:hypothetical protein